MNAAWLCAAIAICYGFALDGPFVFDDLTTIVENPYLRTLWPPNWFFGSPEQSALSSRPFAALTFALNYAVGGLDPRGYHLVNVILHGYSAVVLLAWLRRTAGFIGDQTRATTSPCDAPFLLALWWAVHPLNTDAVTYVTQRTELLAAACYLTTMYAAARAPVDGWSRWNTLAVVASVLGIASKEIVVSVPLMVVLYDRAFRFPTWRAAWSARRMFYQSLACTWLPLAALVILTPRDLSAGLGVGVSSWTYLLTQCCVIPEYLLRCFVPIGLSIDHGLHWTTSLPEALPGAIALVLLAAMTVIAWRRRPHWGFVGAWFFLLLAPSSSFVPIATEPSADRRMYLPLVAVLAAAGGLVWSAVSGLPPSGKKWIARLGYVAVVAAAVLTIARNETFRSASAVWADAAAKQPDNPRAAHNLAVALLAEGRVDEALFFEHRAVELKPSYLQAVVVLASLYDARRRPDEADAVFRRALQEEPDHVGLLLEYARRLAIEDRANDAEACLRRAVVANPDHAAAWNELGGLLVRRGAFDEALQCGLRAANLDPHNSVIRENLQVLQGQMGRTTP